MTNRPAGTTSAAEATPRRRQSKRAKILARLQRPRGVTISELQNATGWQPHSIRAAISRLRKSGIAIDRKVANGKTRYAVIDKASGVKA